MTAAANLSDSLYAESLPSFFLHQRASRSPVTLPSPSPSSPEHHSPEPTRARLPLPSVSKPQVPRPSSAAVAYLFGCGSSS
jgi:hypothetical protein